MINRLLANLPFNPSLVEELSFYSKRLRKEKAVRLIGLALIIMGLLVQIIAANTHVEKSLAASDNDTIRGGVTTKKEIIEAWDNPNTHVADIYSKFGITRKDIADIPGNKPNIRIKSDASNFWSVGRSPLTAYSDIEHRYKDNEITISTAGPTVFLRPLRAWDTGGKSSVYDAFMGRNSTTGETFWILANSGNYTQNGTGKLPAPKLQINQTIVNGTSSVKPGGLIKFRIEYRNRQQDSLAEDVKIVDNLQTEKIDIVSPDNLSLAPGNKQIMDIGNLRYTENGHIFDITARAKSNLRNGTRICNSVQLTSSNAPAVSAGGTASSCVKILSVAPPSIRTGSAPSIATPVTTQSLPPGLSERVNNITQNLSGEKVLQPKVRPGDILEYTLITYNGGGRAITGYNVKDFIGDVTDYADIDASFLAGQGGIYDKQSKDIIWPNQNIRPGQSIIKKFRVKMKNPLPSTNQPSINSTNFDCKISNEYGSEITIGLQCPAAKLIETIPNTGGGSAILITFALASFSGYLLGRNKLLGKELSILRKNYSSAGGINNGK